jgi:hypothetical protein
MLKRTLLLFFLGLICVSAEDKPEHVKYQNKFIGNWDMAISGIQISGQNKPVTFELKGKVQTQKRFDGVLKNTFISKISKPKGAKKTIEGMGFSFWSKEKKLMVIMDFHSDGNSFPGFFKLINESKSKPLYMKDEKQQFKGGTEVISGDEFTSFMSINKKETQYTFEMNWLYKKSTDDDFHVAHQKIEKPKEDLVKYKHQEAKWILKGNYLYRESKNVNGRFVEVIGQVLQESVLKVQIFSGGVVKAFKPVNNGDKEIKWEVVDFFKNLDKME